MDYYFEREKESKPFHLLIDSANVYNDWAWLELELKAGAKNTIQTFSWMAGTY